MTTATSRKNPEDKHRKRGLKGHWVARINVMPGLGSVIGEVLVIPSDLGSIIFAGNVRIALTNNVWNHFQLFAFQVSLLRSGDISRCRGAIREKI